MLEKELAARPGYRLVFCGHSMGAAVAAMSAAMLRQEAPWAASCVAMGIGTPAVLARVTGERLSSERAVFTVVNARDWSPRTSLSSVNELLDDLVELSVARTVMRVANKQALPERKVDEPEVEQLPPGVILQIVHPPGSGEPPKLLAAEPVDYRHSMPVWPDVESHIPASYIKWLLCGLRAALDPGRPIPTTTRKFSSLSWCCTGRRGQAIHGSLQAFLEEQPMAPTEQTPMSAVAPLNCSNDLSSKLGEGENCMETERCESNLPANVRSLLPQSTLSALRRASLLRPSMQQAAPGVSGLPKHPDHGRQLVTEHFGDLF